ncbi:MAG: response regulator [Gemmatimonadales bacterium]|nr:response regulator [Gemmatimonadales bacterium]
MKILLADDDRALVTLLTAQLRHEGHEVIVAGDGIQTMMLATRQQPDAIVLDVQMPGGTGLQTLDKLRANSRTQMIPVLVISAKTDRDIPTRVGAHPLSRFLPKPVTGAAITKELRAMAIETGILPIPAA